MKKAGKESVNFWLAVCVVNAIVIYLASTLFPSNIVLGNAMLYAWAALGISSILLTLLLSLIVPVFRTSKLITNKEPYSELIYYGAVNILGLWLLARAAIYTGFGISSLFVAIILGVVLTIFQGEVRKRVESEKSKE